MTGSTTRPLLFLDVDGPLLPFGPTPDGRPRPVPAAAAHANPLMAGLDPALGPRLAALPGELVWATTWTADANDSIAPLLGLPELPVVDWPDLTDDEYALNRWAGLHWKTRTLIDWAAGRPFAWVDDELTDADREWVTAHHPAPALLRRVHPGLGLTDADFTVLDGWLRRAGTG